MPSPDPSSDAATPPHRRPHALRALLVVAVALSAPAFSCTAQPKPMSQPTPNLDVTKTPDDLLAAATVLAASKSAADHDALRRALTSRAFLERLDSEDEYVRSAAHRLRLARLLQTLSDNPAPTGRQVIAALPASTDFTSIEPRQELLVAALVPLRPAPPEAVKFWDQQSRPDEINLHRVINALADNGSEPAVQLLESRLTGADYDSDERVAWMRDAVLRHRNDPTLLAAAERMLTRTLQADLRPHLVEALCDYRRDWYRSDAKPKPPDRAQATPQAREILERICRQALRDVPLAPAQKQAVEKTLLEIKPRG